MDVIVAYDISTTERAGQTRLRQVADICSAYGHRVQKSVFECRLSPTRLSQLMGELGDTINWSQDKVLIYHIYGDLNDCRTVLGEGSLSRDLGSPWFV